MNSKFFVIITLVLSMCVPYCANAQNKVKKVKYLGHEYRGQVNKKKIPEGNGVLLMYPDVNISGDFNANMVENATVDGGSIKYQGELSFDETKITLHNGGKITIYYCTQEHGRHFEYNKYKETETPDFYKYHSIIKTLEKDSVINYGFFVQDELQTDTLISFYFVDKDFNVPAFPVTLDLKRTKHDVKYEEDFYGTKYENTRSVYLYEYDDEKYKYNNIKITGFKDSQGRIWTIDGPNRKYRVEYPDGSFFSLIDNHYERYSFKINYPDGHSVSSNDEGTKVELGPDFFYNKKLNASDFIELMETKAPLSVSILSPYTITTRNGSKEEIEHMIKKYWVDNSYISIKDPEEAIHVEVVDGDNGSYKNGQFITYKEEEEQRAEQEAEGKRAELGAGVIFRG